MFMNPEQPSYYNTPTERSRKLFYVIAGGLLVVFAVAAGFLATNEPIDKKIAKTFVSYIVEDKFSESYELLTTETKQTITPTSWQSDIKQLSTYADSFSYTKTLSDDEKVEYGMSGYSVQEFEISPKDDYSQLFVILDSEVGEDQNIVVGYYLK
jgi:hypothetical protein